MPATLLILAGTNPRELGLAYCRPQGLAVVVASVDCGLDGESSLARVFQAHGTAEVDIEIRRVKGTLRGS